VKRSKETNKYLSENYGWNGSIAGTRLNLKPAVLCTRLVDLDRCVYHPVFDTSGRKPSFPLADFKHASLDAIQEDTDVLWLSRTIFIAAMVLVRNFPPSQ
jgi:hypothetical protein